MHYASLKERGHTLNIVRRTQQSWLPEAESFGAVQSDYVPGLGLSLFQLAVREIDDRVSARPGDLIAGLAWLAGRVAQGIALRDNLSGVAMEQAANGVLFLRSDRVSGLLASLETGSLAAALFDAALLSGSRRFPDLHAVRRDAMEDLERRGECNYRDMSLSASAENLAAMLQSDVESLLFDQDDRIMLFNALTAACAHAIGYGRHKTEPALAAELALSVAFHAGWIDQRKSMR